jgi:imidazolonepropionase-like amidohydrolase
MMAAKARGIRLLLGTDSGNAAVMTPGKWHGYEAAFFVKHLGYTPLEAIVLQTRENALAMGLQGKLGTIEPGMIADIVILGRRSLRKHRGARRPDACSRGHSRTANQSTSRRSAFECSRDPRTDRRGWRFVTGARSDGASATVV